MPLDVFRHLADTPHNGVSRLGLHGFFFGRAFSHASIQRENAFAELVVKLHEDRDQPAIDTGL